METCSNLLSSVVCNRCGTPILRDISEKRIEKYSCKCGLKIRALLRCVHCQKSFLNYPYLIRKSNYCSRECYWNGTRRKQLKKCKVCGKNFCVKKYLVDQGFGFYCSKQCWFSLFKKWKKKAKCKECGREFLVLRSAYKRNPKFCSKKCADDFKRDYAERICKNCNKRFELPRSDLDRGRGTFCSRDCFIKYNGESSIEKKMRLALENAGIDFKQEVKIGVYRADFLLRNSNVVLECDGEYWHSRLWSEKRDKRKDSYLASKGYKVFRLSEKTIRNLPKESLVNKIKSQL